VKKVIEDLRLTFSIPNDITRFRTAIQDMLRYSDKYQFIIETDKETEKSCFKIKRNNKYEGITDYRSLIHLV
jgi:hypothetical protein